MKTISEIIKDYTTGEVPLEETNEALKEAKAGFSFRPGQNDLTLEEIAETTVGDTPADANGWGLLDTGTGTMDKVEVTDGKLNSPVNTVEADGTTSMSAYVYICGKRYEVFGDTLGEVTPEEEPWWAPLHTFTGAVRWQDELPRYIPDKEMVYDREKYHGVEVVKGGLRYIYAEDGSCQYQPKSMQDYDQAHGRA